jgi:glycosyltransferase involved in cell wall biosynthesis
MARAAIYVLPAKYEPFGLSVLEAAKAGCALALSNIATFSELWENCAIYFDPDDSDAARETLEKLTTDLNFRNHLAARSRQKSSNYTTQRMTDKYYNLYLSIVTQNEPQNKHQ